MDCASSSSKMEFDEFGVGSSRRDFPAWPGRIGRRPGRSRPPKAGSAGPPQKHKAEIIAVISCHDIGLGEEGPPGGSSTPKMALDPIPEGMDP